MQTIRWGMIGCGDVAEVKSGPGFAKAEGSELVAVMRRNARLAEDYARRHGVERWHDDAEAIISAPDLDAVYIATRPDSHLELALRCAAAGKPTYVEKPMAMTAAESEQMVAAFRAAGLPLWVAYYRRALPRFLKVAKLLAEGAIGQVRAVSSTRYERLVDPPTAPDRMAWRVDPSYGRGIFHEGACHTLDFLDFLFGPMEEVSGLAVNQATAYANPDAVTASYRFASGVVGSGLWCFAAEAELDVNEIVGSAGRVRFCTSRPEPIRFIRGGQMEELPIGDPPHVHQPLIQTIVDELNGKGACPSTGETALRTAVVTDRILAGFSPPR
jgi:1,5-anhydro-D-fructose reductase (1,5-anhydro-D-mannitol-forming)